MSGHKEGRAFEEILTECLAAADRGDVFFPISDTIYFEVSQISQHRQRRDLCEVIERLSGFAVITGRHIVLQHEIEALLDDLVGPSSQPVNTMSYLDWGVSRAFGKAGGFRVKAIDGQDVTAEVRASHPLGPQGFDAALRRAEIELNRSVLEGPTPEEEPELRRLGWNPERSLASMKRRVAQEIEQVDRFDENPRWRQGRIRDVVTAREVIIEVTDYLVVGLSDRRTPLEGLFSTREDSRRAFDALPSFDVAVTLKTAYHRNPEHRWSINDIHDIDILGSTLPYCDVVVTDKAAATTAIQGGLGERLGTVVLHRLSDLLAHL